MSSPVSVQQAAAAKQASTNNNNNQPSAAQQATQNQSNYDYVSSHIDSFARDLRAAQAQGINIDKMTGNQLVDTARQVEGGSLTVTKDTPVIANTPAASAQSQLQASANKANYDAVSKRLDGLYNPKSDFALFQQAATEAKAKGETLNSLQVTRDYNTGDVTSISGIVSKSDYPTVSFVPQKTLTLPNLDAAGRGSLPDFQTGVRNYDTDKYNKAVGKVNDLVDSLNSIGTFATKNTTTRLTPEDVHYLKEFGFVGLQDKQGNVIARPEEINAYADTAYGKRAPDFGIATPVRGQPLVSQQVGPRDVIITKAVELKSSDSSFPYGYTRRPQQPASADTSLAGSAPKPTGNHLLDIYAGIKGPVDNLFNSLLLGTEGIGYGFHGISKFIQGQKVSGSVLQSISTKGSAVKGNADIESSLTSTGILAASQLATTGKVNVSDEVSQAGQNILKNPLYAAGNLVFSAASWLSPSASMKVFEIVKGINTEQRLNKIFEAMPEVMVEKNTQVGKPLINFGTESSNNPFSVGNLAKVEGKQGVELFYRDVKPANLLGPPQKASAYAESEALNLREGFLAGEYSPREGMIATDKTFEWKVPQIKTIAQSQKFTLDELSEGMKSGPLVRNLMTGSDISRIGLDVNASKLNEGIQFAKSDIPSRAASDIGAASENVNKGITQALNESKQISKESIIEKGLIEKEQSPSALAESYGINAAMSLDSSGLGGKSGAGQINNQGSVEYTMVRYPPSTHESSRVFISQAHELKPIQESIPDLDSRNIEKLSYSDIMKEMFDQKIGESPSLKDMYNLDFETISGIRTEQTSKQTALQTSIYDIPSPSLPDNAKTRKPLFPHPVFPRADYFRLDGIMEDKGIKRGLKIWKLASIEYLIGGKGKKMEL